MPQGRAKNRKLSASGRNFLDPSRTCESGVSNYPVVLVLKKLIYDYKTQRWRSQELCKLSVGNLKKSLV